VLLLDRLVVGSRGLEDALLQPGRSPGPQLTREPPHGTQDVHMLQLLAKAPAR
jgi:hypothetical protein